jgi:hypothetical protein
MNKTQIRDLIKKAANRKKGIGAIPVGLKFTIAGVKMYVEAQYDIYNKVHINIIEQGSLKTVVKIDGVAKNKKDQIEKLYKFVVNNSKEVTEKSFDFDYDYQTGKRTVKTYDTGYKLSDESKLVPVKKIVDQLSSEVNTANNPGKVATKRSPVRKPVNISPSRAGFVFRLTTDGIVEVPKNTVTMVKFPQAPKLEAFVVKADGSWLVIELNSGLSIAFGRDKKRTIQSANERIDAVINNQGLDYFYKTVNEKPLPKEYLDRLDQYKTPRKTITRPAVKVKTATKTARKVIANRAAKSRPAAVKVKTASKTARKATATRTAKSKPTGETGVLKYSKRLGDGKYEYKYVKKR